MKDASQEKLERYLFQLMKLKEEQRHAFTAKTMQKVADEMGLSESDLAAFELAARNKSEKALAYQKAKRWEDARREWLEATEIAPLNADYLYGLAMMHFEQWQHKGEGSALAQCEAAISECLTLSPSHKPTQQLLQDIERKKGAIRSRRRWKLAGRTLLFLMLCVFGLGVAAMLGLFRPSPSGLEGKQYEIAMLPHEQSPEISGLQVDVASMSIAHSTEQGSSAFDFYFTGRFRFTGHDMRTLRLGLDFMDASGKLAAEHYLWVTGSTLSVENEVALETVPAGCWVYINNAQGWLHDFKNNQAVSIKSARFRHDVSARLLPAPREDAKPLALHWQGPKPSGLDLSAKVLHQSSKLNGSSDTEQFLSFQIENTGTAPCQELMVELQYLNADGSTGLAHEILLISLKNKPLVPGEKLFYADHQYHINVEKGYEQAKLLVKQAN